MRVALTGATGMVGGHVANCLAAAGYETVALVRNRDRLSDTMASFGRETPECVQGDMVDPAAVARLLDGADAVIHCAAVVTLDRRDEERMLRENPAGLRNVVGQAVERGLDPVVSVSSAGALFAPPAGATGRPLRADDPVADVEGAYGRSKAAAEEIARNYQADGAPVVTVYPGGILGPGAGDALGEAMRSIARFVPFGALPTPDGSLSIIDVRDLASLLVALLEPGLGPRRVMCGGHLTSMSELSLVLRDLTGRRFPVLPIPGTVWRSAGAALDRLKSRVPIDTVISREAMAFLTQWPGTEDVVFGDYGLEPRALRDTLADSLVAWRDGGIVKPRHVGRLHREGAAR